MDVVETYDVSVRSATREHPLPSVIRVRLYVDPKTDGRITLNRKNILVNMHAYLLVEMDPIGAYMVRWIVPSTHFL